MKTASGAKFGKTEAGAVWLDPARTSPFQFYQFWLNTDDRDVVRYLKCFTFLTQRAIEALSASGERAARAARRPAGARARGDALVHGADQVERAERAAAVLFAEHRRSGCGRRADGIRGRAVDRAGVAG